MQEWRWTQSSGLVVLGRERPEPANRQGFPDAAIEINAMLSRRRMRCMVLGLHRLIARVTVTPTSLTEDDRTMKQQEIAVAYV